MQPAGPPKPNARYQKHVLATLAQMAQQDNAQALPSFHSEASVEAIDVYRKCQKVLAAVESPIEQRLIFALPLELFLTLKPQVKLANYRADFAFPHIKLAVECDGHEWHKTQTQRTSDARRDRVFTNEGWKIIRFTGSEINADPVNCAREVVRLYRAETKAAIQQEAATL